MDNKDKILNIILGIEKDEKRISTLQLALSKARKLVGNDNGETITYTSFGFRRGDITPDGDGIDAFMEANKEENEDIFTALSLYLIVLDQLGHIFGKPDNKSKHDTSSNRIRKGITEVNHELKKVELNAIVNLRNSINHNFGLANYNPKKGIGTFKFTLCVGDDDGNKRPICVNEEWLGDWCDKEDKTTTHVYPFSLMNFIEKILQSYVDLKKSGSLRSPLCVEEIKARFTILPSA